MWVVGRYEGKRARSVLDHAAHGVGYIILESNDGRNPTCLAAFEYGGDLPLPLHLEEVRNSGKIAEYTKQKRQRQGLRD